MAAEISRRAVLAAAVLSSLVRRRHHPPPLRTGFGDRRFGDEPFGGK